MTHIYTYKIDKVCPSCGIRNMLNQTVNEPVDAMACPNCGEILAEFSKLDNIEKEEISSIVKFALKDEEIQ